MDVDVNGLNLKTFQAEYMIVYLLYHAFKHYYFKILWFIDIYKAFKILDYDYKKLNTILTKYNLKLIFDYYITLSKELFGDCGINPNSILLKTHKKRFNKRFNLNQIIKGEYDSDNSFNRLIIPMYLLPNIKMKWKYLFDQFFPPAEILPEYYEENFNYLKNRLNRITRLH